MASILMGPLVTEAAGVIDGVVFSRNLGGLYVRALSTVFNPQTPEQQEVRAVLTDVSRRWGGTLTNDQRSEWEELAARTPTPNRLGEVIYLSGIALYCRVNSLVQYLVPGGPAYIDDAPSNFRGKPCNKVTLTSATAATGVVLFTTTPEQSTSADTWVVTRMSPLMRSGATRPAATSWVVTHANDEVTPGEDYQVTYPIARWGQPVVGDRITLEVSRLYSNNGGQTPPITQIIEFA